MHARPGLDLNYLGDDAMRVLLPALIENQRSLQQLHFASGRMTSVGLQLLSSCLLSNGFPHLRELTLNFNDFSASTVSVASDVFKRLPSLERLWVFQKNIEDNATLAITSSLHHLQHLLYLDLKYNHK